MWKVVVCLAPLLLTACDFGRSASRIAYWQSEVDSGLPIGTHKRDAERFFRQRGLELGCCISGPDMQNSHLATEKDIGRSLWMRYHATIVVDFDADRVARVRVLRFGVGF